LNDNLIKKGAGKGTIEKEPRYLVLKGGGLIIAPKIVERLKEMVISFSF